MERSMETCYRHVPWDRVEWMWSRHGLQIAPHHAGNRLMKGKATSPDLLNEREQEILQRLSAGFSDQQIADELFLSLHTVKWYNRQIYSKLGVKNRTQAIARAKELGLLEHGFSTSPQAGSGTTLSMQTLPSLGRNPFFLGREEVLTRLRRQLQAGQAKAFSQPQVIC